MELTNTPSLLRSTPVTQSRVPLQETMSACGLTGCWITALTVSRLGSMPASAAPTLPAAGTGVGPHLRKTSWTWLTPEVHFNSYFTSSESSVSCFFFCRSNSVCALRSNITRENWQFFPTLKGAKLNFRHLVVVFQRAAAAVLVRIWWSAGALSVP